MKAAKTTKNLSPNQREELLATVQTRFDKNPQRHPKLDWAKVKARLDANPGKTSVAR